MPKRTVEAVASNAVFAPAAAILVVTFATGAWSGVIASARGLPATTGVPPRRWSP